MTLPSGEIPDFELIRRMADHGQESSEAREAWSLFYIRHHQFLRRVCASRHGYLLGAGVKDLVQDAFVSAFNGAQTFDHGERCGAPEQELKCRGWLLAIAQNLVRDRYRGQPEVRLVDEADLEVLAGASNGDADRIQVPESDRLRLLKSAFGLLSDAEQTVLRATMLWWQADRQHQRMPESAMQQLSIQIGKSPDTIRQMRLRALRKLEKHVNDYLDNEKAD